MTEPGAPAARALTGVVTDPARVAARDAVTVHCTVPDLGPVLVDFLNALIYEMALRRMPFTRCEVAIEGHTLTATAWGDAINRRHHRPAVEAKGATYTALRVAADGGHWIAQCAVNV